MYITLKKVIINGDIVPPDKIISLNEKQAEYLVRNKSVEAVDMDNALTDNADAPPKYNVTMKKDKLIDIAKSYGVNVPDGLSNKDIVALIDTAANNNPALVNTGSNSLLPPGFSGGYNA